MLKDFINKSNFIHNNIYDYSIVEYLNSKSKVKIICPTHGQFNQRPNSHLNGQGCPKCYSENRNKHLRKNHSNLINDFKNYHKDFYDYSLVNYINTNTKVIIICPIHDKFEQSPQNHINGHGCPKCALELKSKKLSKNIEDVKKEFNITHNNKYDYSLMIYKNNKSKINVICPTHGIFKITPSHHLNGVGCSKCSNNYSYTNDEFIKKSNIIHNFEYDYSLVEYKNSYTKIKIICKKHGEFSQTPHHHSNGVGCPKCNSSKGEKKIRHYLKDNKIKIEEQKRFKNCRYKRPLPFDFYLPEYNCCIEFDGEQHFRPSFGKENFIKTKRNDNIKNIFCKENGLTLLRITYKEIDEINEKLKSKLKEMT